MAAAGRRDGGRAGVHRRLSGRGRDAGRVPGAGAADQRAQPGPRRMGPATELHPLRRAGVAFGRGLAGGTGTWQGRAGVPGAGRDRGRGPGAGRAVCPGSFRRVPPRGAGDRSGGYPPGARAGTPTVHGQVHTLFAVITITALASGCFVLARRFAAEPGWRRWAVLAVAAGVAIVVFIAAFGAAGGYGGL